jgi:hypothetical protein
MTINTDFSVAANGNIRYVGAAHGVTGAGYYTTIAFHRWLQDLADDASSTGDDYVDITRDTPSDRSTDNIITLLGTYNIDQTAAEHLYDGSIIQAAGADIWDGLLVLASTGMDLQIVQNGALLSAPFWNTIPFGLSVKGLNADVSNGISHRFMLKVRTSGADIEGRRLLGQTRVWGKTNSEFKINGTSRGNNVMALTYADDLNNATAVGTVGAFTGISNTEGYQGVDVNNDSVLEFYYSKWLRGTNTISQFYEYMKYVTRQGSATTLYGMNGELFRGITHEVQLTTPRAGTFAAQEAVSWTGGTGRMLAINSTTAGTKMWIQLLTGVAPSASLLITGTSTATATNTGTPTEYAVPMKGSLPICGASTGSSLIGSYGFGIIATALGASDKVFDLTNTLRQAPNYVSFPITNLVSGDQVLVGPSSGGVLQVGQMTLNGALTGAAVTAVIVTGAIPADTPLTGTIRILRASGIYSRHAYTSWTGSTFTIGSTSFSTDNAANGANTYVSYVDGTSSGASMTFTSIYASDRNLYVRVRNGTSGVPKIKTYESVAVLGASGGSVAASRISDE